MIGFSGQIFSVIAWNSLFNLEGALDANNFCESYGSGKSPNGRIFKGGPVPL